MVSWLKFLSVFILSSVFAFALIAFVFNVQISNDAESNIMDSDTLRVFNNSMQGIFNNFTSNVGIQQNASISEVVDQPTGAFILFSITSSIGRFLTMPLTLTQAVFNTLSIELGVPPIILGIFLSLIILAGIFYWYRTIKTGD